MAGLRSNVAWVQWGKQSVKGTAVVPSFRSNYASDDRVAPRAEFATFPETDATRDAPDSQKMVGGTEGSFQVGSRDSIAHSILEAAMGTKVTSGSTNFTHTLTGANSLAYWTIEEMLGDLLWERFTDQVANELTINVEAGGFMTMALSWLGRTPTRLTAEPTKATLASDTLYTFNDAAVSIGGAASALVRSMNLTLTNNLQAQQTDDFVPYDIHAGQREVTVGFDMIFEDLAHYNAFHYGTTTGTTQSATTFVTDLNFLFTKGANNSMEFDLDALNYEEYPVTQDPGGDPLVVPVRARSRRNATTGLLKAIVKNQQAA